MKLFNGLLLLTFLVLSDLVAANHLNPFSYVRKDDLEKATFPAAVSPLEEHTYVTRARKKKRRPPPPPPKYGQPQTDGERFIAYLNDPNRSLNDPDCKIRQSTVTYQTLQNGGWNLRKMTPLHRSTP